MESKNIVKKEETKEKEKNEQTGENTTVEDKKNEEKKVEKETDITDKEKNDEKVIKDKNTEDKEIKTKIEENKKEELKEEPKTTEKKIEENKNEEKKEESKSEGKIINTNKTENKKENEKMEEEEKEEKKPGFRIEAKGAIKDDKDPISDTKSEDSSNPRYLLNQMYQKCDPSKQKDIIITKSEVIFIVGDTQRISIAKVNGKVEMDFRSYHFDDVMFLGKYGLNMSLKDWDNLKKKMKAIDEAIYKLSH